MTNMNPDTIQHADIGEYVAKNARLLDPRTGLYGVSYLGRGYIEDCPAKLRETIKKDLRENRIAK